MRFQRPVLHFLVITIALLFSAQIVVGQGLHKKKKKPSFMLGYGYGMSYQEVMNPADAFSQEVFKYENRSLPKSMWTADLTIRQGVYKNLFVAVGLEYAVITENISEGFILLHPESAENSEIFASQLSMISGSLRIGETFKKKKFDTHVSFGPIFNLSTSYTGSTLSEEWKVIEADSAPSTNLISAWDLAVSIDFDIAKELDLSLGLQGRLGRQMVSHRDDIFRNYNGVMGKVGFVYYPGRNNSTIHTVEREDKLEEETNELEETETK